MQAHKWTPLVGPAPRFSSLALQAPAELVQDADYWSELWPDKVTSVLLLPCRGPVRVAAVEMQPGIACEALAAPCSDCNGHSQLAGTYSGCLPLTKQAASQFTGNEGSYELL